MKAGSGRGPGPDIPVLVAVADDGVSASETVVRPDPQVRQRATRRRFTAKYKMDILTEYDAVGDGAKGAILRREGLYSSLITEWRRARDAGALAELAKTRGRKPADRQGVRIAALEADKRRLEQELATARAVMGVQAKLHALLETISESADTETRSTK
jgi:transposase-like protein